MQNFHIPKIEFSILTATTAFDTISTLELALWLLRITDRQYTVLPADYLREMHRLLNELSDFRQKVRKEQDIVLERIEYSKKYPY